MGHRTDQRALRNKINVAVGAKSARNGKSPGWPLGEEWGETCRANISNMADGFEGKKCSNVFRGTFVHSTSQNAMEIMQDKIVGISLSGKVCVIFSLHGCLPVDSMSWICLLTCDQAEGGHDFRLGST